MKEKTLLMIFVRNEVKGQVKTRLAKDVGDHEALDIYQDLLSITKEATDTVSCDKMVVYSDFIPQEDRWDESYQKGVQHDGDLGQRLYDAFYQAFKTYERVIVIGSDLPDLNTEIVDRSILALDNSDTVVGPAKDGGYYLLGMNELLPELFIEMPWSTDQLYYQTMRKLNEMGKTTAVLRTLSDLDDINDLHLLGAGSKTA